MSSHPASSLGSLEWTKAVDLLRRVPVAYLALVDGGRPYVVPVNFGYLPGDATPGGDSPSDDRPPLGGASPSNDRSIPGGATPAGAAPVPGRLVFHTGPGRKTAALAADPRVCVAVSGDERFIQAETPCKDGFSFRSVLVEGPAVLLTDPAERDRALRAIVAKHDPAGAAKPFDEAVLAGTLVYAVDMETISYKEQA